MTTRALPRPAFAGLLFLAASRVRLLLTAAVVGVVGLSTGCASKQMEIGEGRYQGPPLGVETSGGQHVVVARAPTPGWEVTMDANRKTADATRVFMTLRRPNPGAVYAQMIVTQRVRTEIDADEPIELFAREVPFSGGGEAPYLPVRGE